MWRFVTPVLVLGAFILSLLVSLSAPIIKSIELFDVSFFGTSSASLLSVSANATGDIGFGAWGYCVSNFAATASVGSKSGSSNLADYCTQAKVGYTFDDRLNTALDAIPGLDLNSDDLKNLISAVTVGAFVLHIVATILIFFSLLLALLMLFRRSRPTHRGVEVCSVVIDVLAALVTSIVFLIDVIFVSILKGKLHNAVNNSDDVDISVKTSYGNAVWMMLGAAIVMWLAVVGSCAACCAGRRRFSNANAKY